MERCDNMEMGKELKLSLKIEYQKDTDNIEITTNGQSSGITFPAKMFLPFVQTLLRVGLDMQDKKIVDLGLREG